MLDSQRKEGRVFIGVLGIVLGGIGLFLLGMTLLTEGLKDLAGDSLKRWLNRFTGGTFSSIVSGTVLTAVTQSSTASTLMTIGFVSAGLLTFVQSIGIIIGANIGTTSTGWIVSLIGFKINIQTFALPIIGIGIFLKLFSKGRFTPHGHILAGFGLLFLGIELLQEGMLGLNQFFLFDGFMENTLLNRLLLILVGIVMTIIMQSSSAAVATTITALHVGAIQFELAAALVIGQNIGTTLTAIVASIGASISAKRTALTHVLFNVITGFVAIFIFPFLIQFTAAISTWINGSFDPALGIAVFHTLFSIIGALIVVPFILPFSNLIIKIMPEKGNPITRHLDPSVATIAPVAIESARKALMEIIQELTEASIELFKEKKETPFFLQKMRLVEDAAIQTREFLSKIPSGSTLVSPEELKPHLSVIHALDHLDRLLRVLKEWKEYPVFDSHGELANDWKEVLKEIRHCITDKQELHQLANLVEESSLRIAEVRRRGRNEYFIHSITSEKDLETTLLEVDALLWIDRVAYHYWRALSRLIENELGKEN